MRYISVPDTDSVVPQVMIDEVPTLSAFIRQDKDCPRLPDSAYNAKPIPGDEGGVIAIESVGNYVKDPLSAMAARDMLQQMAENARIDSE